MTSAASPDPEQPTSDAPEPGVVRFYSDIGCPWASLAVHRLRRRRAERGLDDVVRIDHRAFPLELFNEQVTPKTIVDPARILARIDEARRRGYAVAVEESTIGEIILAAAILGPDGAPLAAVHIAGSLGEWTPADFEQRFAPLAVETAQSLSRTQAAPGRE